MVTYMSNPAKRSVVPALASQLLVSAYVFGDELDGHGVVLTLHDDSDISIKFDRETRLISKVIQCKGADGEAVLHRR